MYEPTPRSSVVANVISVVVLVLGLFAAAALFVGAILVGLCGLFGEQCSSGEADLMNTLALAAVAVYVVVPVGVAAVRRQARWLLALPIETAGLTLAGYLVAVF